MSLFIDFTELGFWLEFISSCKHIFNSRVYYIIRRLSFIYTSIKVIWPIIQINSLWYLYYFSNRILRNFLYKFIIAYFFVVFMVYHSSYRSLIFTVNTIYLIFKSVIFIKIMVNKKLLQTLIFLHSSLHRTIHYQIPLLVTHKISSLTLHSIVMKTTP